MLKKTPVQFVLFFLIFLAVAIRLILIFVARKYPTADEVWALHLAKASFDDIWLGTFSDLHPPLYFLFLKTLGLIWPFELNIIWLRMFSLFWGILGNLGVWYLVSKVSGKRVGLIAFIITLFLPGFIWPAIYGRYYSLLIFLTITSIAIFRLFLKRQKLKYLISMVVIFTIGTYTHYYFFLLLISFGAFLVFTRKYRFLVRYWVLLTCCVCLLLIPGIFSLITFPKPELFGRHSNHLLKIPAILVTNLTSWEDLLYFYLKGNFWQALVFAALGAVSLFLMVKGWKSWRNPVRNLFLLIFCVPPAIALIFSYGAWPLLALGSLQIFLPAQIILIANGIALDLKGKKILSLVFAVSCFLSLLLFFYASYSFFDVGRDFAVFARDFRKGDAVLHSHIISFLIASNLVGREANFGVANTPSASYPTQKALGYRVISINTILARNDRIWYFEPPLHRTEEDKEIKSRLDENFVLLYKEVFDSTKNSQNSFEYFNVYLYGKRD